MSYNITPQKYYSVTSTNAALQEISTTYTEISGTKCAVSHISTSPDIYYHASFFVGPESTASGGYSPAFLHIKLQKSNDDFSSNIVDVEGCQFNFSGDTSEGQDIYRTVIRPLFIVPDFGSTHLRLVARSHSTGTKAKLHYGTNFPPNDSVNYFHHVSLICAEL
jgi:hypothetical protein